MTTKTILPLLAILFLSHSAVSQNCNLAIKDGSKIALTSYSWVMPGLYDLKFQKLKEEQRDEKVLAFNETVSSGKLSPATTNPMIYVIKKEAPKDGADQYTMTVTVAGKDYTSYIFCKADSLFFYRRLGPIDMPDGKGGSIGFMLWGAQVLPLKLKVGDKLPTYDDMLVLYPQTIDATVKKNVFNTVGHNVIGDPAASSVRYNVSQVDVKIKETLHFSQHTVHYMNAIVTGEEEVNIGGVKYKAYIINSETWAKPKLDVDIETADKEVRKGARKAFEQAQEFLTKSPKKQSTNSIGYTVTYLKEWFVPAIPGVVKSEIYDAYGSIAATVSVTSVQ